MAGSTRTAILATTVCLPEPTRVVGCWAHLRRKFDGAVKSLPKQDQHNAAALQGQAYCRRLFSIEQELAGLPPEERYTQHLARSKPVMNTAWAWAKQTGPLRNPRWAKPFII